VSAPSVGSIGWIDLTVPKASEVAKFYSEVTGWKLGEVSMGDHCDYNAISPSTNQAVAGICHAQGPNAGLPPQWLIYITVADLEASAARVRELGGTILKGPESCGGYGRICVIKDPSGAAAALFEPAATSMTSG
jgi:uncharacterized protein